MLSESLSTQPFVDGNRCFINGEVKAWSGSSENVTSPILDKSGNRVVIGTTAMMGEAEAKEAVAAANRAWNMGRGAWPQMKVEERIAAIQRLVTALKAVREGN